MSLRNAMTDLADEVRPVDLSERVTAGVRRRRQRRVVGLAAVSVALVAAAALVVPRVASTEPTTPGGRSYDVVWLDDQADVENTLFAAPADGSEPVRQPAAHSGSIDVSPDGRKVAVVFGRHVEVGVIGRERRRLDLDLPGAETDREVSWAPDSRRLAVTDITRFGQAEGFWIVDTVSGDVDHVAYRHHGTAVSWSPDGQRLAVNRPGPDGYRGIDVVTTDGRLVTSLGVAERWYLVSNHAWSPDGTRLVVLRLTTEEEGADQNDPATLARALVVDVAAGTAGEPIPAGRYVWRSADTLAARREGGVFETDLAGRALRRLYPFGRTGEPVEVAIRAAS